MIKNKENILNVIVALACILTFIYFVYDYKSHPTVISNPCKTIGVCTEYSSKAKGTDIDLFYFVKNKKYKISMSAQGCVMLGQKYNILYDSINPSNADVLIKEPVFTRDQITRITYARISNLGKTFFSNKAEDVSFDYIINGQFYDTYQYSDWDKYNVKVGDKCELEYLVENPAICIIHLDKKVK